MVRLSLFGVSFAFIFLLTFSCKVTQAQFSYAEVGVSYGFTPIGTDDYGTTALNHSVLQISPAFFHRPVRWGAVGIRLNVPVFQTNNLEPDYSGSVWSDYNYFNPYEQRFEPVRENYSMEQSLGVSAILRFFITQGDHQLFVDGRYTFSSISENYVFQRSFSTPPSSSTGQYDDYPDIPAVSIDYEQKRKMLMPGFSLGWMGMLSDYFYVSTAIDVDFLIFSDNGFSYRIESNGNEGFSFYDYDYANVKSPVDGMKPRFAFSLTLGTYF